MERRHPSNRQLRRCFRSPLPMRCPGPLTSLARQYLISAGDGVPVPGDAIRGTYREAVQRASGRCALVENAQEFTLVPWRPVIERSLGREIVGLVTEGGISWQIGRDRGIGI